MQLRALWVVLLVFLAACNMSVNSLTPSAPETPGSSEQPPTPFPDTPAPPAINASPLASPQLLEIEFLNELDGWGITASEIVRTNDGGMTWYDVTPPEVESIGETIETFFLDNDHVWLQRPDFNNFPNNGLLYHTADGGETWTISSTPFSAGDLSFVDEANGWMLADLGVGAGSNAVAVFQTADGGATWTQTYTNDPNQPDAADSLPLGGLKSDLVPLDTRTAWIGGVVYSPGTVYLYRTEDGGETWSPVTLELPAEAQDFEVSINEDQMRFFSARDGFLVVHMSGEAPQTAVYVTGDGGETWTLTPTIIPGVGSSEFLSSQEAVLYNGETFYVTHDGASSWTTVTPDIVFGDSFGVMDFVNPENGWIVTRDANGRRALYRTQDGGATWLPLSP